ncbi:roadblock/LC7 domain-containing protein [Streptomyces sp. IBSNAI002]|uniref:roadblock/LC7 domain-containing protein n=1 Tax=Streptomyces sp. IBSNAI002 TaxID=3457500 RepID=UPI003FD68A65
MRLLEARASDVQHVIADYRETTPGMERAVLVSSGGLVLASSGTDDPADAERLAALTASLMSMAKAAAQAYRAGAASAVVINTERHNLCLAPVDDHTGLIVVASADTDLGHVMYVAALIARELASLLDNDTRAHLCRLFLNPG